jgi:hypothetical protein
MRDVFSHMDRFYRETDRQTATDVSAFQNA